MAQRPTPLLFGLGLLVGVGGALYFRLAAEPAEPVAAPPAEVAIETPTLPPSPAPALDPDDASAREEAIRATRLPSEVRYPIEARYRDTPLSAVPYTLVAAYDDMQGAAAGRRRRFILAVAAGTSRESVAQLVEDVRARHIDAEALRIEVFDSKVAATHPAQAGVSRDPHRVAAYSRDGANTSYELLGEPATP